MNYSLAAITTVADCDAILDMAILEQDELSFRKTLQDRQYRLVTSGTSGVDAELTGVISQKTALEAAAANLPEGPAKQDLTDKIADLQHKQFQLEKRRRRYGIPALLQKEYDITAIEKQIAEHVSYMDAVTQRKIELARP
ncbi:MAG: hypothetical protein ABIN36_06835 [Ferruginibacter sp.]